VVAVAVAVAVVAGIAVAAVVVAKGAAVTASNRQSVSALARVLAVCAGDRSSKATAFSFWRSPKLNFAGVVPPL
jgi:hypothetical protein